MRTIYLSLFNFQKLSFVLLPANNTATTRDRYLYLLMIVNFYLSDFECMKNVNVSYVVTNEYELSSQKWTLNNVKIKHIYILRLERELKPWPSLIPAQCSTNWANRPTKSRSFFLVRNKLVKSRISDCEYVKIMNVNCGLINEYESDLTQQII